MEEFSFKVQGDTTVEVLSAACLDAAYRAYLRGKQDRGKQDRRKQTYRGATTLAYRPSRYACTVELTDGDVRQAFRKLLLGSTNGLDLKKLLSLSWGISAIILCNDTYTLADIEASWGLVAGMGCISGTGFGMATT